MSDINITPLTDVLLVLLIIFLVTATGTATSAFRTGAPRAAVSAPQKREIDMVVIRVGPRNEVFLDSEGQKVADPEKDLARELTRARERRGTNKAAVLGHDRARYGTVVMVMDACKRAGLDKVSLVLED